jgi:uncharacterized protein (DUF1330 family)
MRWRSLSTVVLSDGKAYGELAVPAVHSFGGRFLTRSTSQVQVHEARLRQRTVIVEFDSYEIALAAHESEAYQKAHFARRISGIFEKSKRGSARTVPYTDLFDNSSRPLRRIPGDGTSAPNHSVGGSVLVSGLSFRFRGNGVQCGESVRWQGNCGGLEVSRRCCTDDVPGISSTLGERWSNQANHYR